MTYNAESSSFRRSRSIGGRRMCDCGLPAKIFTAWTNKNPGRKFFGCELYKEMGNEHCKFFEWFDEGEVTGWPKRALIEARDEIREKRRVINELRNRNLELSMELEKKEAAKSNGSEDEMKRLNPNLGWKNKFLKLCCIVSD
ncbi:hypothetical protein IGI04_035645 [Brassica rapa subsp. trilocularis]|uniref:GRF-type domain-containing protein n=1 Tax=Brassica rapa subsp. trilocularis TaxID=1813537 RepID=A0ABQ7LEY7_BRACM|nr:uncharacterized protein LOC103839730 [Brassica rapa]XP_009121371.1 uncharacterized protein LOC103846219 [Brassica rapa]XP_013652093.2 uncharacterized protein LOC106356924 [Brassica napus]XP_013700698.1 uncharacterized protein LOC106404515 [Brassica napus]XP_048635132.1 uncharacterized protein LOC125608714 [Brassica napus]KAG5384175.1 hypothetical protein IGI04_035645 [Brassica rapa subsp. trilocularis]